jgi:hypothetical protein
MRKNIKLLGAVAVAGLVAATGSAFTAGNTIPASVAGYGTSTISGATATALSYTLNAEGTQITASALTFTGDQTGRTIKAGFGADALTACTVGAFTAGAAGAAGTTAVTCGTYTQSTATSASYNVAVS